MRTHKGLNMSLSHILDELSKSGLVIRGREHVDGLLNRHPGNSVEQTISLFEQGRGYGVYLYHDRASFDEFEFARKLGELGFDQDKAKQIILNLRPEPAPETSRIETF